MVGPIRRRSSSPVLLMNSPSVTTSTPKDLAKRPRLDGSVIHTPPAPANHRPLVGESRSLSDEGPMMVKSEPRETTENWRDSGNGTERWRESERRDAEREHLSSDHHSTSNHSQDKENDDLVISPPQNYTAQVRHVIRQRLLASSRSSGSTGEEDSSENSAPSGGPQEAEVAPDVTSQAPALSSAVTVDTSAGMLPYYITQTAGLSNGGIHKEAWGDKLPLLPPSGPASWPVASQDKLSNPPPGTPTDSKFYLPGHFSPMLSVGIPGIPPLLPSTPVSPAIFSSAFPPGFPPRGFPLPPGITFQELAALQKPQLVSPQSHSSVVTSAASVGSREQDDRRSYVSQTSGRSSPEVLTDINGNSEKELTATSNGTTTTATGGEQKVYVCEYCNKHFLFKSKYHEHLPVHTNARPYQCHLCSRTYKYKYDLQVHLRTHMGIPTKSTVCPFCSGKFETNKMLRNHIVEAHQDRQKVTKEECTQPIDNLPPAL